MVNYSSVMRAIGPVFLVLVLSAPVSAADGTIQVWEPTTLSTPGSYVLTRDIVAAVNPVILITSDNVHLDLNGFTIEGENSVFAADVIRVLSVKSVVVENGTVIGGGAGVRFAANSSHFVVRNLLIRSGRSGVAVASDSAHGVIENNVIQECTDDGMSVSGSGIQVRDNVISAAINGIKAVACDSCQITGNIVQDVATNAISISEGNGNLILRNSISNAVVGILVSDGGYHLVESNVLTGNTGFGFHLTDTSFQNIYRANVSRNNGGSGCAGVGNADFCDDGAANTSGSDNFMPDLR